MFYVLLRCLGIQLLAILGILAAASCGTALASSPARAIRLLELAIRDCQGLWVWTLGWGLVQFVHREALGFANDLAKLFDPSEPVANMVGRIERSRSHREALVVTLPITALGLLLTISYQVPLGGGARWLVILGITSIYYAAAFLLWHFLGVMRGFNALYASIDSVRFQEYSSPRHLERVMNYLTLTTTVGVAAIYAGFRGTLTAGFLFPSEVLRSFLVTPLVLFLPATLLYNFHPRYVLRSILQHSLFSAMKRIRESNVDDAKSLLLDIRDLGMTNAQVLPFMDYKSVPSYIIAVLFVVSLAYHNDPAVQGFFGYLLGLSQP
jgi:hypothetical protein